MSPSRKPNSRQHESTAGVDRVIDQASDADGPRANDTAVGDSERKPAPQLEDWEHYF